MLKTFIDRPVLSTVISIIIVMLGLIGLTTLPVAQYPEIAPPTIQVSASYSGANAEVIMNSVIVPLEEQINGVENMTYMTSTASNNGIASITVYFEQGVDPDIAAINVQNRVSRATPLLPQEVVTVGVTVSKQQSSNILFLALTSDNSDYDDKFSQNYANINLIPVIKRVPGVGDASVFGAKDYSMRIWLKPDVMASYGITPTEVMAALLDQNIEAAAGEVGQNSNQSFQYTLKFTGKLKSEEQFENIVLRSSNNQVLRLKDVARVELGALYYSVNSRVDGKNSVVLAISQAAGSNAQTIIEDIQNLLAEASKTFPPGLEIVYMMSANDFLDASISKVITTLIEAFLLVFLVVFVFLQDFRSTLIPAISIPVAIVGTFFFLQLFGFTINLLTLFALILAIGIVVDDAIVVVEAVHAQLDAGEKDPRKATMAAMSEIAPAIIAITLVMSAVFVPVSFIQGTSGIFYKQFGLTIAIAIVISAVNALTLSPALCAIFLKPHSEEHKKKSFLRKFYYYFNLSFDAATQKYKGALNFLGRRNNRWISVAIVIISTVGLAFLMKITPTAFVPQEDGGGFIANISLPPGSSLERTDSVTKQVVEIARTIPSVAHVAEIEGVSFLSGLGSSYATIMVKLVPWSERDITTEQAVGMMFQKTAHIQEANMFFFGMPTLQGFGLSNGFEFHVQDKTGGSINDFYMTTMQFLGALNARPEIQYAMTTFNPNFPQYEITANVEKIKDAGLTLTQVMTTLQAYIGSMYISNFNLYGKQFRVMLQSDHEYRASIDDLGGMYVQNVAGQMAPITEFISMEKVSGPQSLDRFNMFSSMSVTGAANEGYSSGEALVAIQEVAAKMLPAGQYAYDYSGLSREEANSSSQTVYVFMLCLLFIYFLLAALYESYILPLAVIFSLPIGLAGVFVFLQIFGISNNIYVQISLIMLIGLLAKNAILIVEYAIQRRQAGMTIVQAAVNGAVARLRPILMTSFAFIIGLSPLMFATGAGAIGNRSIGTGAIGGMFIGTMIGVIVIPTLYIIFQTIQEKFSKPKKTADSTAAE